MYRVSLLLLAVSLTACGGSDLPPPAPAPEPAAASEPTPLDTCVAVFARQKECTDDFIPALVDLRIRHDVPTGVADQAANGGRDALIATAMQEWAEDSQEPVARATCEQMIAQVPPEQLEPMLNQGRDCAAMPACGEFVHCILPQIEQHLAAAK